MQKETVSENIIRSLVQVCLSISSWNGKVISPELSKEMEQVKNAEPGAVEGRICYLTPFYTKPIGTAESQLRTYFKDATLPWSNDGWRVISSKKYQELMDGLTQRKRTFDDTVNVLIDNYDSVYEASKVKTNTLFNADKFPSKKELAAKYGVYIYRNSVNSVDDVRISGLSDAVVNDIKLNVAKQYQDQIQATVLNIIARLREVAVDAITRTTEGFPKGSKPATLITKINKTCDSLSGLNITNDSRIDKLIEKFKSMGKVDAESLRESDSRRTELKSQAQDILTALDSFKG